MKQKIVASVHAMKCIVGKQASIEYMHTGRQV